MKPLLALLPTLACTLAAQQLDANLVVDGLDEPVFVASPPDGSRRLFVLERGSSIVRVIDEDNSGSDAVFLDLSSTIGSLAGFDGLLGLAFHPNYASNRRLFLYYTTPNSINTRSLVIAEYQASATDPDQAASSTPTTVFLDQPALELDHIGGTLAFGNDGYLYAAIGDGDNANPVAGISQDVSSVHGKVLRFDVDAPAPHIPANNPFLSDNSALPYIWAVGLRNPFGFSFDASTGDLWIGDVGQSSREEVNRVPAGNGGWDFQWDYREGTILGPVPTTVPYANAVQAPPVYDYAHAGMGGSIIGGRVYRGFEQPWLRGRYFYGDFVRTSLSSFDPASPAATVVNHSADLGMSAINGPIDNIVRVCQDANGELLLVEPFDPNTGLGAIWRVVPTALGTHHEPVPQAANSSGKVAKIGARGSLSISDDQLWFVGRDLPPNTFGMLVMSRSQAISQPNGGPGYLYLGGTILRVNSSVQLTDGAGRIEFAFDLQNPPVPVAAGETWTLQWWFRDSASPGFSFSEGVEITIQP